MKFFYMLQVFDLRRHFPFSIHLGKDEVELETLSLHIMSAGGGDCGRVTCDTVEKQGLFLMEVGIFLAVLLATTKRGCL